MHVTQRGVNRCAIFLDDLDKSFFLSLVRERFLPLEVRVHAYALMDNHYHLLVSSE